MTVYEYEKYTTLLHVLALIEDDLRTTAVVGNPGARVYAAELLWRFF